MSERRGGQSGGRLEAQGAVYSIIVGTAASTISKVVIGVLMAAADSQW